MDWKIYCDFQIIRKWITDIVRRFRKMFRIPAILPANHHKWRHNHHLRWPNSFSKPLFIFLYTCLYLLYFLYLNYLYLVFIIIISFNYVYCLLTFIFVDFLMFMLTSWLVIVVDFYFWQVWLLLTPWTLHVQLLQPSFLLQQLPFQKPFSSANPSTLQRTLSICSLFQLLTHLATLSHQLHFPPSILTLPWLLASVTTKLILILQLPYPIHDH